MAMIQSSVAVGVFSELAQARQAIDELRRAGFNDDEIGFLTRAGTIEPEGELGAGIVGGAAELVIVGAGMGVVAGILIPALGGAVVGGAVVSILGSATIGGAAERIIGFFKKKLDRKRAGLFPQKA